MTFKINHLCKSLILSCDESEGSDHTSVEATNKIILAFVISRLDCCLSLLAGLADEQIGKLQGVQNTATSLVLEKKKKEAKHEHITPLLKPLHWLPLKARIEYTAATQCCHCLHTDTFPIYLSELLVL